MLQWNVWVYLFIFQVWCAVHMSKLSSEKVSCSCDVPYHWWSLMWIMHSSIDKCNESAEYQTESVITCYFDIDDVFLLWTVSPLTNQARMALLLLLNYRYHQEKFLMFFKSNIIFEFQIGFYHIKSRKKEKAVNLPCYLSV